MKMTNYLVFGLIAAVIGCDSENCINSTCHYEQATPYCTYGCIDAYAGNLCKEHCHHECFTCERYHYKNCTQCSHGKAGTFCREKCDDVCLSCERYSITQCTQCQDGYYGTRCQERCVNCRNDRCCVNGSCVEGCKPSWWGRTCDDPCPEICADECDFYTGSCIEDTTYKIISTNEAESSTSDEKQVHTTSQSTKLTNDTRNSDPYMAVYIVIPIVIGNLIIGGVSYVCKNREKIIEANRNNQGLLPRLKVYVLESPFCECRVSRLRNYLPF